MSTMHKRYVKGSRELTVKDILFDGDIDFSLCEDGNEVLEFYLGIWFESDKVFGTDIYPVGNDAWINAYALYNITKECVEDDICIIINFNDNAANMLHYRLSNEEKVILFRVMDVYCMERENMHLHEFPSNR